MSSATWSGNANSVKFNSNLSKGNRAVGTFKVTLTSTGGGGSDDKTPVTLSWSAESANAVLGEAFEAPTLKVEPAEAAAAVVYSSSKAEVATVDAEGKVTLVGKGVTDITATISGNETYENATAKYTLTVTGETTRAKSIAEAKTMTEEFIVDFPLTVGYGNGTDIYATDGKDWILIYKGGSTHGNGVKAGDVIAAGWLATYELFKSVKPELIPSSVIGETSEGTAVYATPEAITTDMINSVVLLKDVTIEEATPATVGNYDVTFNGATVAFRNKYKLASQDPAVYTVTGVVDVFNGNAQVYPVNFEKTGDLSTQITPSYKFAVTEVTAYVEDETIALPELVGAPEGLEIVYTSSDEDNVLVDNGEILFLSAGVYTITASNVETEQYKAYSTSFTLNVLAEKPAEPITVTYDFTKENAYGLQTTTNGNFYENNGEAHHTFIEGDAILNLDGKYRSWSGTNGIDFRPYKGASFSVSAAAGYVVTKIEFAGNKSTSGYTADKGSLSSGTWTSEAGCKMVTFNVTATLNISTITVTLQESAAAHPIVLSEFEVTPETIEDVTYNRFDVALMIDDNGVGAENYDIVYNGMVVDNVKTATLNDDIITIEYLPYAPAYDFVLVAKNAEGEKIESYNVAFAHPFNFNAEIVELGVELGYYENDLVEGKETPLALRATYGIDVPKEIEDMVYTLTHDVLKDEAGNISWLKDDEGFDVMLVNNYTTATWNGTKFEFAQTTLPEVAVELHVELPVAHKEIKAVESANAPAKAIARDEVVTTTKHVSLPQAMTAQATPDSTTTGVEGVATDNVEGEGAVELYNLNGVKVDAENAAAGVYIRRQGAKVEKIVIR